MNSDYIEERCVGYIDDERKRAESSEPVRKFNSKKHWTKDELMLFYKGITVYGLDLSMLERYFQFKRTRKELKARLRVEQKVRPEMVKKAMDSQCSIDEQFIKTVLSC